MVAENNIDIQIQTTYESTTKIVLKPTKIKEKSIHGPARK